GLVIAKGLDNLNESKRLFTETNVKSLWYDRSRDIAWISTSSGLVAYHLATGRYRNFTEDDGLPNSYVFGVLADSNELWISTNFGLSRGIVNFQKDSVLPEARFTNYTRSDGLSDNQLTANAFHEGK